MAAMADLDKRIAPQFLNRAADGWRKATLEECAELIRDTVSPSEMDDALYIGLEHIGEGTLSLVGQGTATDVTSTKARFKCGDTLFGKLRPYFRKVVRAPANGLCSTDIWVVRAKKGVEQGYLHYCMASHEFVDFAMAGSTGTRMPRADWEHVSRYIFSLPPLSEQRAIARILGTLDDKIELNRRMNETLEEMARTLFKSWFVDFDPVRAKIEGRYHRGESLPGLSSDLYNLFPDRLVDSELGEIPEEWEVKALEEVVKLNPPEPMKRGTVAHYLDMASLPTSGSGPSSPILREFKSGTRFRNGDTLLARITPCLENGKTAFVQSLAAGTAGWGSTEFIVMRAIPPVPSEYTYLLARDAAFREHAIQSMTGTSGRQRVQVDALAPYLLPYPPAEIWAELKALVSPLFAQIEFNRQESLVLAAQRDALLPGLVSGGVRVT